MPFHVAALRFASILTGALATGGLAFIAKAIAPTMLRLPEADSLRLHQEIHWKVHPYMPGLVASAAVLGIVVIVFRHDFATAGAVLTAVGVLGYMAVAAISQFGNTPINNYVAALRLTEIPRDYESKRARWIAYNTTRTAIAIVALSCYVAAALAD